jgi:hypothetical protein
VPDRKVSESDGAKVHTRRTWAGADPETELASQTGPAGRIRVRQNGGHQAPRSTDPDRKQSQGGLEPDGPCPSRTESDGAGTYQAHARRAWIGARPLRIGAEQDVSESDGAGAQHTGEKDRSRTKMSCRARTGQEPDLRPNQASLSVTRTCWDCRQAEGY